MTGEDIVMYKFPNKEVATEWDRDVLALKDFARRGPVLAQKEKWCDAKVATHIREWFLHVRRLESDFGSHMVPPDVVRCATGENHVLEDMGLQPTQLRSTQNKDVKHKGCAVVKTILEGRMEK